MDQKLPYAHDIFPHIRIVMGMVIGLGVTRLLSGLARIVQHPGQYRLYPVHLAWVVSVLLMLVHFWWWEFGLFQIETWTFGKYLFIIFYAVTLFLLCALLFPDSMLDYTSYEDFFYSRRAWFFGLLAASYLLDVVDTLLKGPEHFARFGVEYFPHAGVRRFMRHCDACPRSPLPHRLCRRRPHLPDIVYPAALRHDRLTTAPRVLSDAQRTL